MYGRRKGRDEKKNCGEVVSWLMRERDKGREGTLYTLWQQRASLGAGAGGGVQCQIECDCIGSEDCCACDCTAYKHVLR